jgi:phospholipid transport system transporter-binding protein
MNAEFARESSGVYQVAGDLVFETVRNVLAQSAPYFASDSEIAIDLSKVTQADSAGLALLMEWYCLATASKRAFRLTGAPPQLLALAKISNLETVLPFA